MDQLSSVKASLLAYKPELIRKYALASLGLFGSVVRDDFSVSSDIDIVVSFSKPIGADFIDLADDLERMLKRKVDLVSRNAIRDKYFKEIEADIIYV